MFVLIRRLLLAALLSGLLGAPAGAETWPSRPVRLIVGFPPGGAVDIIARLYSQKLSMRLGQPVVVENKPGTGGNLASDLVAKSTPDGYTLLHATENVFITNPHVYGARMPFDPFKDVVPVTSMVSNQIVLTVNPSLPANTLKEFVELAKSSKPPLFYASIGNGSNHHLAMELLKQHVGIELTHVPYRGGGPAALAVLTGEVSAMFGGGSVVQTIKSGKLRGLATTGVVSNPAMPELPTIAEFYPGYEALSWHAVYAPAGTPQAVLERLRQELQAIAREPEFAERLLSTGSGEPYVVSPDELTDRIKRDYEKYGKLVRSIGMKVEN